MSYILEALRKSERQRRELEAQPLVRLAAYPAETARRRFPLLAAAVVLVGLVAAAAIVLWFWRGREVPESRPSTVPMAVTVPDDHGAASQAAADALSADSPAPSASGLGFAAVPATRKPQDLRTMPPALRPRKSREAAPVPRVPVGRGLPRPASPARSAPEETIDDQLAEDEEALAAPAGRPRPSRKGTSTLRPVLPTARLRAQTPEPPAPSVVPDDHLPRPKINVYAYSATADRDRFVVIGGRKYHEGDRLDDGPAIRRIEETAVTLDFEGRTYQVPRP